MGVYGSAAGAELGRPKVTHEVLEYCYRQFLHPVVAGKVTYKFGRRQAALVAQIGAVVAGVVVETTIVESEKRIRVRGEPTGTESNRTRRTGLLKAP